METRSLISFDWAMKRLLRNKANFDVLEGFLSELLRRKIIIKSIGESESNKTDKRDKSNKVDILVEADARELVIVELQYDSVNEYFQRMLYGVSKAVTEHIYSGESYAKVRKVYSVNIVYFALGKGDDYVYLGTTNFKGLHTHTELQLTGAQQQLYGKTAVGELYPEYYIINVTGFNDVAKDTLDEWIYYLKNNRIQDDFTAQGLDKARQILALDKLSAEEKKQYARDVDEKLLRDAEIRTALFEGELKGEARGLRKGLAKGEAKGRTAERTEVQENVVINSHRAGLPVETVASITGLTSEQITEILQRQGLI